MPPFPDPDPLDCRNGDAAQHGTHVAGIAGGNGVLSQRHAPTLGPYNASFDPSMFIVAPGVAPQAELYALKVFGCSGGTTLLAAARSSGPSTPTATTTSAIDSTWSTCPSAAPSRSPAEAPATTAARNLHQAGTLLVAAAGNEGDTTFAHGSPASLPEVLSVGASVAVASAQLHRDRARRPLPETTTAAEGAFTRTAVVDRC